MKNKVYDYFLNLEEEDLQTSKGAFIFDRRKFQTLNCPEIIKYKNTPFYIKKWRDKYSINSIASSAMYNTLGLLTPPVYKLRKKSHPSSCEKHSEMSQDVHSLDEYECILCSNNVDMNKIHELCALKSFKWTALYNNDIRQEYLKFMTEECFDELISAYLLAELRTDGDLHEKNFFLVKRKGSPKFERIIPIDLELSKILGYCGYKKSDFENFIYWSYSTVGPDLWVDDPMSYKNRIVTIKELIQDGVLSSHHIEIIKNALNYDFPDQIKKTFNTVGEKDKKHATYNSFSYLWDYNRKEIGKEINL